MTYFETTFGDLKELGCDLYSLDKSRSLAGNPLEENETLFVSVYGDDVRCGTCREGMAPMASDDAVVFIDCIQDLEEIESIPW